MQNETEQGDIVRVSEMPAKNRNSNSFARLTR